MIVQRRQIPETITAWSCTRRDIFHGLIGRQRGHCAERLLSSPAHAMSAAEFPIVGIGASAGGIDAFHSFLANMPADCGMEFDDAH